MSVKKEIVNGVFWIALAKYSGVFITIAVTAVLARLISPAAFGTIAIAMVILHFLNILADIGIGPAIVQYRNLTKKNLNDIFTITILVGLVLSLILYFVSEFISLYYKDDILHIICQCLCIVVMFNSLNVVPNGLMRREKRFRTIALRTLFFHFFSGILAVWAAFNGWGIYALLVSPVISSIGVFCVNFYNYPQRISLRIEKASVLTVSSFSIYQFLFSFCNYFSRNLDKLIVGKYFSMTQLGYYDKSYHLMMVPVHNISSVIEPVLHPVLASFQDNVSELKNKNIKLSQLIAYISFPVGLILYFCGSEIIRIVYGSRWDEAVPVFKILALSLPFQVIFSTVAPVYQAAGKTKVMFWAGVLNTFLTISGFFAATFIFGTLESIAWSWDITLFFNFINSYTLLHFFALSESPKSFFFSLIPQVVNSCLVFAASYILFSWIVINNILLSLVVKSLFVILLTILFATNMKQYKLCEIASAIVIFRKKK